MVGRQPFGGNRLSGTGTKAGGPDYLLHFVEPKVVTENTVRHGLVDLTALQSSNVRRIAPFSAHDGRRPRSKAREAQRCAASASAAP